MAVQLKQARLFTLKGRPAEHAVIPPLSVHPDCSELCRPDAWERGAGQRYVRPGHGAGAVEPGAAGEAAGGGPAAALPHTRPRARPAPQVNTTYSHLQAGPAHFLSWYRISCICKVHAPLETVMNVQ